MTNSQHRPNNISATGRIRRGLFFGVLLSSTILVSCGDPGAEEVIFPDGSTGNGQPDIVKTEETQKNVVFILVDDLGYSDIGAYNPTTFYETPNIDRLAAQGVQFVNGYAVSPICSPTRAALMAGKHPTRMAATDWFHKPEWPHNAERFKPATMNEYMALEEVTVAESFKANGYKTAFLGKWHLGLEEKYWPEHQGFDINIGGHDAGMPLAGFFAPYENPRMEEGPEGEYLTERLTDEAINLLDEFSVTEEPFFMYLSYYTVHIPLQAPADTVAKYEIKGESLRGGDDFITETQYRLIEEPRQVRIKQNHAAYAAMIEEMDMNVGRVLDKITTLGLDENTIVVFTSDNGGLSSSEGLPTSNEPLRTGKGWVYEGGVRVPLIVRAPRKSANGTQSNAPITSMDFYPTLLSLAGLDANPEQHVDGVNFSQVLNGDDLGERPLFFHYPHYSNQGGFPGGAVRLGDYKLIHNLETGEVQLFDLAMDIGETSDIKQIQPEKTAELQSLLFEWYKETNARFLRPLGEGGQLPWALPEE